MTNKQQQWAAKHDWFISKADNGVIVYDSEINKAIFIDNFTKLREWAGY